MRAHRLASLLAIALAVGAADVPMPLTSGGLDRTCILHIPDGISGARPLVLLLHGHGGSGAEAQADYGFDAVADPVGVLVAYPDGIDSGHGRGWASGQDGGPATDDVAYLGALVDAIAARTPVDPARVYACGMSNGAMMAQRLAAQSASRFAAVASVAGPMVDHVAATFAPSEPVSVMIVHGDADPIVPYAGGAVFGSGGACRVLSAAGTAALWCSADGIIGAETLAPLPNTVLLDGTRTIEHVRPTGLHGFDVVLYQVVDGGHTWPGAPASRLGGLAGRVSLDWSASSAIWAFFAAHAKAGG